MRDRSWKRGRRKVGDQERGKGQRGAVRVSDGDREKKGEEERSRGGGEEAEKAVDGGEGSDCQLSRKVRIQNRLSHT